MISAVWLGFWCGAGVVSIVALLFLAWLTSAFASEVSRVRTVARGWGAVYRRTR